MNPAMAVQWLVEQASRLTREAGRLHDMVVATRACTEAVREETIVLRHKSRDRLQAVKCRRYLRSLKRRS